MQVYECKVRVKMQETVLMQNCMTVITYFIDSSLCLDKQMSRLHNVNKFKYYVHDSFYPVEKDGLYKNGDVYTFRVRTVDADLFRFFSSNLAFHKTRELQGIGMEIQLLSPKWISELYSISPIIIKTDKGYWRNVITYNDFQQRIKSNLCKKYNQFTGDKIDETFALYDVLEFKNRQPIKIHYKSICLLGDKLQLQIASNPTAQKLARFALGVGLCEMNAEGYGFVNFK